LSAEEGKDSIDLLRNAKADVAAFVLSAEEGEDSVGER
jgi:hypothetical protein